MLTNIIGFVLTAVLGFLIAFVNYAFSKKVLVKNPDKYSSSFVFRQVLQVAYLVAVYFVGSKTQLADLVYLLVGAVVGMTIPMFFFTKKLLSFNESINSKKYDKESETDG